MTTTGPIDLRSDTVTLPTREMREAMAKAEVGDDVRGEDPTVIRLEERAAELLDKEAGLFVSSGTQANLVSLMAHLPRGSEIIAAEESHIVLDEAAGYAVVAGASVRVLPTCEDGTMNPSRVAAAFRNHSDIHEPLTGLVALENTHCHSMGQPLTACYTREIAKIAHDREVPLHIDGSRLFNASVALGVVPAQLVSSADSVTFCLSKGLACPVGSLVVGTSEFIDQARRARKLLGGGMRQAGVLAAAGLIALRDGLAGMITRLIEDHANARRLADGLANIPGISGKTPGEPLDSSKIRTNIVFFRVQSISTATLLEALRKEGILMSKYPDGELRAVTHYGITEGDIEKTIAVVGGILTPRSSCRIPPSSNFSLDKERL